MRAAYICSTDGAGVYSDNRLSECVDSGLQSLRDLGIDSEVVQRQTGDFLSQPVITCFLSTLRQINMTKLSSFADMVKQNRRGENVMAINAKLNFLFTPVMINPPNVSLLNKNAEPEFWKVNGTNEMRFNFNFWKGNLETKQKRNSTQVFSSLDVGLVMPDWILHSEQLEMHKASMQFLFQNGPMCKGGVMQLSLRNYYATLFLQIMNSPLTIRARSMGYQPLLLIKNCLLQKNERFGLHGCQLSTIDLKPKSYVSLAGYFRGNMKDRNLHIITMTNRDNNLLVEKKSNSEH